MCNHAYQYYSMLESVDVKLVPMILMLIQCIVINIVYIQGDSYEWFGVQKCGMQSNKCPQICCAHMKWGFIQDFSSVVGKL